ncbi:MAG: hypothetical protein C4297_09020 [Gemmataceae bacterium]
MRQGMLVALLLLAGCQSIVKPFEPRSKERADDPLFTATEQQRRARYLHPFPDAELGPRSRVEPPELSPHGR